MSEEWPINKKTVYFPAGRFYFRQGICFPVSGSTISRDFTIARSPGKLCLKDFLIDRTPANLSLKTYRVFRCPDWSLWKILPFAVLRRTLFRKFRWLSGVRTSYFGKKQGLPGSGKTAFKNLMVCRNPVNPGFENLMVRRTPAGTVSNILLSAGVRYISLWKFLWFAGVRTEKKQQNG